MRKKLLSIKTPQNHSDDLAQEVQIKLDEITAKQKDFNQQLLLKLEEISATTIEMVTQIKNQLARHSLCDHQLLISFKKAL